MKIQPTISQPKSVAPSPPPKAPKKKFSLGHIPRFEFDNYEVHIGEDRYPVTEEGLPFAVYYDLNKDGILNLKEMKKADKQFVGEDTAINREDFLLQIRQHMIGKESVYKDDYPSLDEIYIRMHQIAGKHPDKVELVTLGESTEGRPIKALRISNDVRSPESKSKPSVVITGNLHAREWITNDIVGTAAEKILEGAAGDALDNLELWMIPNTNPDGYVYSRDVDPMWRKNTWKDENGKVRGVDLNRQFPHYYRIKGDSKGSVLDDLGANDDPSLDMFRGEGPVVEPEAKVLKDLMDQEKNGLGLLDVHSFGQLLLAGSGTHDVTLPEYQKVCEAMNRAMPDIDYQILPDDGLYPVTGGLTSYADSLGWVGIVMETAQAFQPGPEKRDTEVARASEAVVEFVRQMNERSSADS